MGRGGGGTFHACVGVCAIGATTSGASASRDSSASVRLLRSAADEERRPEERLEWDLRTTASVAEASAASAGTRRGGGGTFHACAGVCPIAATTSRASASTNSSAGECRQVLPSSNASRDQLTSAKLRTQQASSSLLAMGNWMSSPPPPPPPPPPPLPQPQPPRPRHPANDTIVGEDGGLNFTRGGTPETNRRSPCDHESNNIIYRVLSLPPPPPPPPPPQPQPPRPRHPGNDTIVGEDGGLTFTWGGQNPRN
ncbi:hypothetical protein ACQ4PT_072042 [Festuca glaucescens]